MPDDEKNSVERAYARVVEKLREVVAKVEEELLDADARAALAKSTRTLYFKVNLGHCIYAFARTPLRKRARLSPRQEEIARLFITGAPRREIANTLNISPRTVDTHMGRLFVKYGVNTRIELAQRIGLLS